MIPLIDLKAQHRSIQKEIREAIDRVLETSEFALGSEVEAFETEFADYSGARHGVAVNSGTSALHLALLAAGIGAGDEVITVPFTFVATVAAIIYAGARPLFVDIDPRSYTMDVTQIEHVITKHEQKPFCQGPSLWAAGGLEDPILEIARRHHLVVIEDAAQAHGAEYKGRRVGSIGDLGCFSFYPTKNLGACGEGGMVVTNRPEYDQTIRLLRDWGQESKYYPVLKGYNYRMEALQGAILRVKLRHLETWTEARRAHAARYDALLSGCGVYTPQVMAYARHVYHVYAIRMAEREVVQQSLMARGIQSAVHYPFPVHLLPAYADLGHRRDDFPQAGEDVGRAIVIADLSRISEEGVSQVLRERGG